MRTILSFSILTTAIILNGCASLSAAPVSAQVVDAATHQPLKGVVVVAYWELHQGSFTGDALPCGAANVQEAVTDRAGQFRISGWGPMSSTCDIQNWNPLLILFKSGYDPVGLNNDTVDPINTVSVSHSEWDGKTIELHRHLDMDLRKTDRASYMTNYTGLNDHMLSFLIDYPGECNWKKTPNTLRAILAQDKAFNIFGVHPNSIVAKLITTNEFLLKVAPQCGSPKAFIEGLE